MANETLIAKHMKTLGITREEAIQLIEDDEAVDGLSKRFVIVGDLILEERKRVKSE